MTALTPLRLSQVGMPLPLAAPSSRVEGRSARLAQTAEVQSAALRALADSGGAETAVRVPEPGPAPGDAATVHVQVKDVNGDGSRDVVVRDAQTGDTSALLNTGNDDAPRLDASAVRLSAPSASDLDRLAVVGKTTDAKFIATDLDGDGRRDMAVKSGDQWLSLGDDAAGSEQSTEKEAPVAEAERRYQRLIAEFSAIIPAFALSGGSGGDSLARRYVGFVQMLDGNVDQNPLRAANLNADDLGQMVMSDATGAAVSAFSPFGVGLQLYLQRGRG